MVKDLTEGTQRPLGIPALEDKIVQKAAKILTAIYEQDFLDCSYGYRLRKGAKDAVSAEGIQASAQEAVL
jgi:retron-type reverse transcriptase